MGEIILFDAGEKLKEEICRLRAQLAAFTSEFDELRYHICPELAARYARGIGDLENRINYQKIMILEMKRRIEIARAALNREKTVSQQEIDRQVNEEYRRFHEKADEAYQRSQRTKREQEERARRKQQYERKWEKARENGKADDDTGSSEKAKDRADGSWQNRTNTSACDDKKPDASEVAKELYRRIVKRLHPDMNPDITEHERELFYRAVQAYKDGNIEALQEIYDELFVNGFTGNTHRKMSYTELLELRDRLRRQIMQLNVKIGQIKKEFPYCMKDFLDDENAVQSEKKRLMEQILQNEETLNRLMKILEEINKEMEEMGKREQ